jgi:hypothetical protein
MCASAVAIAAAAVSAALATLPSTASAQATGSAQAGLPIPAPAAASLRTAAVGLAQLSGDARPGSITAVATTYTKALQAATPGDKVVLGNTDQTVYLVVIKGEFTLKNAPVPPGAHNPTGRYLAVIFDPSRGKFTDGSVSDQPPSVPLQSYGPVADLTK